MKENIKILIISPAWIGDMVMGQSLYKTLKKIYPNSIIDVVAPDWSRPILERMPEVNSAIRMPLGHGQFELQTRKKIGIELRKNKYDWAIIQPNSFKSALIPYFAKIKKRTAWRGESRYLLVNDMRTNKKDFPLMVERYVALAYDKQIIPTAKTLPPYNYPSFKISKENQAQALKKLNLNTTQPILSLCAGAEFGPAKKWSPEYYAEVAMHWIKRYQGQVWLFGSKNDIETGNEILQYSNNNINIKNLSGKTDLGEAIDLMGLSSLVISNDSGLMHIASALELPLIAIYGSSSPKYTPPLNKQVEIIHTNISCRPCFKKICPYKHTNCLNKITPIQVINKIENLV